jgi:hypothetical protein
MIVSKSIIKTFFSYILRNQVSQALEQEGLEALARAEQSAMFLVDLEEFEIEKLMLQASFVAFLDQSFEIIFSFV